MQVIRPIHRVFILEYLRHFNGAKAYRAVRPHVTARSSKVMASRWLADPKMKMLIEETLNRFDPEGLIYSRELT